MLNVTVMWVCIIGYLAAVMGISQYIAYNERKKYGHYNVFKAKLPWPLLLMTYIASLMSIWVFFGAPGAFYRGGLSFYLNEITFYPLCLVVMCFTTNRVWVLNQKRDYTTPADFFYDRFKSPTLRIVTGLVFLCASFPYVTSVMVSIARAADVATAGAIGYTSVVLIIGLAMVVFTAVGGFKSVAWTDTIQGIIFMSALACIAVIALIYCADGSISWVFDKIYENVGGSWFSYPGTYEWTPYAARFGYPLSCLIGYNIMLPHVFVRSAFAGQDLRAQRKFMALSPVLQFSVWSMTALIGAVGIAALPDLSNVDTEMIIPYILENVIHPENSVLAVSLMVAFFVGAAGVGISTADSFLLVGASIISEDFIIKSFKRDLTIKQKERIGRLVILIIGTVGVVMALNPPDMIYTLIMFAISIVMPLFPILVFGMYWKRATKTAALVSSIVGAVLVLMTYFVWDLGGIWYGAIGLLANLILMPVISLLGQPDDPQESAEFFEALDSGMKRFYNVRSLGNAKKFAETA